MFSHLEVVKEDTMLYVWEIAFRSPTYYTNSELAINLYKFLKLSHDPPENMLQLIFLDTSPSCEANLSS